MPTCLVAWELGGGLGHVTIVRPVLDAMLQDGCRVFAAVQDIGRAALCFRGLPVEYLQAPHRTGPSDVIERPANFTQILFNTGFGDPQELAGLAGAWRHLYGYVRPDLILFNHSPLALFAAQGLATRRVVMGTGFEIPPDAYPSAPLRRASAIAWAELSRDEDRLLESANRVAAAWGALPLKRVTQLYAAADLQILATFPELDHYPSRSPATEYWGCWPNQGGAAPVWPPGKTPRVFAYLKPFPHLVDFARLLVRSGLSTILCFDGSARALERALGQAANLHITSTPLDLRRVGQECDLAVLTGGHGSTASLLLSGKPLFLIPNNLEQSLTAAHVQQLGAGVAADRQRLPHLESQWAHLLGELPRLRTAAEAFATTYAGYDAESQLAEVIRRVRALLLSENARGFS